MKHTEDMKVGEQKTDGAEVLPTDYTEYTEERESGFNTEDAERAEGGGLTTDFTDAGIGVYNREEHEGA